LGFHFKWIGFGKGAGVGEPIKIDQRYEVIKILGSGFSGEVFLVRDGEELKALKFLKKVQMNVSREEGLANFKNEFSILKELNHPNIARIMDFGFEPRQLKYYFTTEFIEGCELGNGCAGQPIDVIEKLIVQVLRALNYLHSRGIYHFDIKPQNILVAVEAGLPVAVKIIDFGLAGFTNARKKVGTPAYMAPEVVQGGPLDGRADLYSMGVLIYKLLTGTNPFAAKGLKETMENQLRVIAKPPSSVNPEVPKWWDHLVARLLEKNPAQRYSQASLVIRDLNFLSNRNYEIETKDTKLSYLPDKGSLIGRDEEWTVFTSLFAKVYEADHLHDDKLLIIEGEKGTGKTRLLSEIKYHAQLKNIPVKTLEQFEVDQPLAEFILMIDDDAGFHADRINALAQEMARERCLILWATTRAPKGFQNATVLGLKNFDRLQLKTYLESVTGLSQTPNKLIEEIYNRTLGNPLFVSEFIKSLLHQDMLFDAQSGKWKAATFEDLKINFDEIHIPTNMEDCLLQNLQNLSEQELDVLKWLAVNRMPLSVAELETLSTSHEAVPAVLLSLVENNLIEKLSREHTYYFKNYVYADIIVKSCLPKEEIVDYHLRLSKIFEDSPQKIRLHLFHKGFDPNREVAIPALLALSEMNTEAQQFSRSVDLYKRVLSILGAATDPQWFSISMRLGQTYLEIRRYDAAVQIYKGLQAQDDLTQLPITHDERLFLYDRLTEAYFKLNETDRALEVIKKAKCLLKIEPNRVDEMIFDNCAAYISLRLGQVDLAMTQFSQSYQVWETEFSLAEKTRVTNNYLLNVLLLKQDYKGIIAHVERSLPIIEKLGNRTLLVSSLYSLGEAFRNLVVYEEKLEIRTDYLKKAIAAFRRSEDLARQSNNHAYILRSLNGLGSVYFDEKDFDKALECYERALVIAQKKDPIFAADISNNISNIFKEKSNFGDSYAYLVYSINTLLGLQTKTIQNWFSLYRSYIEIADTHIHRKEFERASLSLDQAEEIQNSRQIETYAFYLPYYRAKIHAAQNLETAAKTEIKKAEALAKGDTEETLLKTLMDSLVKQAETTVVVEDIVNRSYTTMTLNDMTSNSGDLKKILEINTFINSEQDVEQLLKLVLTYAIQLSNAEAGFVILLENDGSLRIRKTLNATVSDEEKLSTSIVRKAIETGAIISSADALSDDRFDSSESIVLNELKSILCLPIKSKNKTIGVFYLDNRFRTNAFANSNVTLLNAFCDQVGIAMENAHLIAELKEAQQKLQKQLQKTSEELDEVKGILKAESENYKTRYAYKNIVAQSEPMRVVFRLLDKVTETSLAVFLHGASGTGKELVAKALHYNNSVRQQHRFVAINCGAIPANLMESELFGYKAGSFTGAVKDKKGLFEEANGGTLFLDEIAELEPVLQVKLLRVLQEGEVQKIGDSKAVKVDVRIICASHKNLEDMVKQNLFREDLYYRLCQMKIDLPPLVDRKEDIVILVKYFVDKYNQQNKSDETIVIPPIFMKAVVEYSWPGNVRELENFISVACALRDGVQLSLDNVPPNYGIKKAMVDKAAQSCVVANLANLGSKPTPLDAQNQLDGEKKWHDYEAVIIAKCYEMTGKRKAETAEHLGLSHSTIYKKIQELNLDDKTNPLYADAFVYVVGCTLKDYVIRVFQAALLQHDGHPYAAIRQLGVSQGYFYKIMKEFKVNESVVGIE
jgi:transcriptional regulator with GAF, ATPase, and Fis domain/serine/threonine protein kinase